MGNRRIILFLLCGIAVCSFLIWGLPRYSAFVPVKHDAVAVLTEQDLSGVERVSVDHGDARIGLCRVGGHWMMEVPFQSRVDRGAALQLLDLFESSRVHDSLSFHELRKRELSLKEFGLAPPRTRVVLEGKERHEFSFGSATPLGKGIFARAGQQARVLVVPGDLYEAIPRTADDIRSRRLVGDFEGQINEIEIRAPERPFIKLSKESGTWRLTQPVAAPAADDKVEALLNVLASARVNRFIWPTISNVMDIAESEAAFRTRLGIYGLRKDTGTQIQLNGEGMDAPVRIAFGIPVKETEGFTYVLMHGETAIGTVSNAVVEAVKLSPTNLRDMRLFTEPPVTVNRLHVTFGQDVFVLSQSEAQWRFVTPMSDMADQTAVAQTVKGLLNLSAEEIEDELANERSRDSNKQVQPISRVEIVSGAKAWRLSIKSEEADKSLLRVVFTNSPAVFHVASSNVPSALISTMGMLGLRDKTVLALPASSLRRITIKRGKSQAVILERLNKDAAWRVGDGVAGRVAEEGLNKVVGLLENLKADRIEKLGASLEDIENYGLLDPWLSLSVDVDAADAVRKTLLVGKEAWFGKRYAMVRGLDIFFVLSAETLDVLSEQLVDPLQ